MNRVVIEYISLRRRYIYAFAVIFLLTIVVSVVTIVKGADNEVVLEIRATRVCSALLVGAMLSLSGVVMQTLLKNPLASPYTLGISNSAAFGAAVGILFLGGLNFSGVIILCAFAGTLVGLTLILIISGFKSKGIETIILAGVVINSLFSAGIAMLQYIANSSQMASILFWSFGDLNRGEWRGVLLMGVVLLMAAFYFYNKRWHYKALICGDDYAKSIGVAPKRERLSGLIVASLITAIAVSIFGVIAFVGLAVPQMVRKFIGNNIAFLLPLSIIFGALFMVVCDIFSRILFYPIIMPVGIVTSMVGVPLFILILYRYYKR